MLRTPTRRLVTRVMKPCVVCKELFNATPKGLRCSKCAGAKLQPVRPPVYKTCIICTVQFRSFRNERYCRVHSPKHVIGRKPSYIQGRAYVRHLVRQRDGFSCQDCGQVRNPEHCGPDRAFLKSLDVHHLNGMCGKLTRAVDLVEDMPGLITLCHSCHYKRHDFSASGKAGMHKKKIRK